MGYRDSSCCSPCSFLCSIFKFLLSIVIFLGIIVLVLWLVFRPNEIKAYVDDASLTRFSLANGTLDYNLTLDLSIRNPNRRISIQYNTVEAVALYANYRFGYDNSLPSFFQDHKNTTVLHPAFAGQKQLVAAVAGAADYTYVADAFGKEKDKGVFSFDVRVYTRVKYKVWFIKSNKFTPKFQCTFQVPLSSTAAAAANGTTFSPTRCDVNFF